MDWLIFTLLISIGLSGDWISKIYKYPLRNNVEEELEIIKEIGFKGDYLTHPHTLSNYRSYWQPESMTRQSYNIWQKEKKSLTKLANQKINEILNNSETALVSQEVDSELKRILAKNGVKL